MRTPEERNPAPVEAGENREPPSVLESHVLWLARLREHVYGGRHLDAETAARDDECDVAAWLRHGEGRLRQRPEYWRAVAVHTRFHQRAARVARLANAGRRVEAELELGPGSELRCLSAELVQSVLSLRRLEAGDEADQTTVDGRGLDGCLRHFG